MMKRATLAALDAESSQLDGNILVRVGTLSVWPSMTTCLTPSSISWAMVEIIKLPASGNSDALPGPNKSPLGILNNIVFVSPRIS